MFINKMMLALMVATVFLCRLTLAEKVTLQATLVADTMCESSNPDTNYEAIDFGLDGGITSAFYYGRDHSTVTRFAALQLRLPFCPQGMRASAARLKIYAANSNRGTLGFARLADNPDLSVMTWNSAVAGDYIEGTDAQYRVSLGTNAVSLSETLIGGGVPVWYACEMSMYSLTNWFGGEISKSCSNLVTLLTLPVSGDNATLWRGGHLEEGHGAELEVDFIAIGADVPATNNLLVALQPEGIMTDSNGAVVAWMDSSALGGSQDFVQSDAQWRPTLVSEKMYDYHNRDVVDFNSLSNQYLELASSSIMDTNIWSWFVVFKPDVVDGTHIILRSAYTYGASGSSDQMWGIFQADSNDDIVFAARTSSGVISYYGHIPPGVDKWCVSGGAWNGTGSTLNGRTSNSISSQLRDSHNAEMNFTRMQNETSSNAAPSGHIRTRIGSNSSSVGNSFDGQIAEILIYKTALSEDDESDVMDYLHGKYFKSKGTLILLHSESSSASVCEPESTVVFADNMDGYPTHRIPSLVTTQTGTLLAICEGRGLQEGTHGDISGNHLVLKRSTDNGETWGPLELINSEPENSLLGPCAVVTDSGRIVFIYHRYLPGTTEYNAGEGLEGSNVVEVFVMTSDDEGMSWSGPSNITAFAKQPTVWTGILTGPGIAIQKRRAPNAGRIVVPCAHGPVGAWHCYVIYSDDDGITWSLGGEVPDPLGNECQVVELIDGSLMINTRSYRGNGCRAVTYSQDGGLTWSAMQDEPALPEPICQGSIFRYSDPLDGEPSRIIFSNPADTSLRQNGTLRLSLNEGVSWTYTEVLVPGYYGYSCLTRLQDGRIGCLYETEGTSEISFSAIPLEWLMGWDEL